MEDPVGTPSTTLLRQDEIASASSGRTAIQAVPGEPGSSILIVDDDEANRTMLSRRLQRLGFRTTSAEDGRNALEKVKSERFDLMLLDIQMPELDGFEATAAIRAQEYGPDTQMPIIAMTAHAMAGDRERCLAAGMDGYVSKPIQAKELFAAIEAALTPAEALA